MGAVADRILELSLRQEVNLARVENGLVRDMIGLLDQADLELEARISQYASEGRFAAERRAKAFRRELAKLNGEAYKTVGKKLTGELAEFGARVAPAQADIMEKALPFAFSFTRPSENVLRSIITSQPFQGALIGPHIQKIAGNREAALLSEIQQGLLQGDSLSQIMIRVRGRKVRGRFTGGVLDSRVGRPALEGLVRTATQHVQTTAQQTLYEENADFVRGVMWVATLDHRTCKICQVRDGLVWDFDPQTGIYTPSGHDLAWLGGPGRAHWQCRCAPLAVLRNLDAFERAGLDVSKLTKGERAAMGGPVPASTDYEEWIRTQPQEIQEIALGKRRAAALRDGGKLEDLWRKSFQVRAITPAPLAEVLPVEVSPLDEILDLASQEAAQVARIERELEAQKSDMRDLLKVIDEAEGSGIPPELARRKDNARERYLRLMEEEDSSDMARRVAGKQYKSLREEVAALRTSSVAPELIARRADLSAAIGAAERSVKAAKERFRDKVWAALGSGREEKKLPLRMTPKTRERIGERADQALRLLGQVWRRPIPDELTVQLGVRRARYSAQHQAVVQRGRRVITRPPTIKLAPTSPVATILHELGHWLEDHDPAVLRRLIKFRDRRTAGETWRQLKYLIPKTRYPGSEWAKPDKFLHAYMGKRYQKAAGAGRDDYATEILSMGLEWLWSQPHKLYEGDREMFEFILRMILDQ